MSDDGRGATAAEAGHREPFKTGYEIDSPRHRPSSLLLRGIWPPIEVSNGVNVRSLLGELHSLDPIDYSPTDGTVGDIVYK